ncbi:MAG: phosphodiester glycosidase family protein [Cyanobacteria bacterium J06607_13]
MTTWPKKLQEGLIWISLLVPIGIYGSTVLQRPPRVAVPERPLFQGVTYSRQILNEPRPQVIHILEVDLTASGIEPFATPGIENAPIYDPPSQVRETRVQPTSTFLEQHRLQLAINANFFYPFREMTPWHYRPKPGGPASLIGFAMSDGQIVSLPHPRYYSVCFLSRRIELVWEDICPAGTQQAVSGQPIWIRDVPLPKELQFLSEKTLSKRPYPLTLAAIDETGTRLWLLLSDGKQPLYAEGTSLDEAAPMLKALGATQAVQLDGGGSTTIAIETEGKAEIINAVINAKIPGFERPVASHIGFYAEPLAE